jgi:NADH-quinone oxidoreductase subunit E
MADAPNIPDEAEVRARWGAFAWDDASAEKAKEIIARYPPGRQQSATLPLLDLAQRQVRRRIRRAGFRSR